MQYDSKHLSWGHYRARSFVITYNPSDIIKPLSRCGREKDKTGVLNLSFHGGPSRAWNGLTAEAQMRRAQGGVQEFGIGGRNRSREKPERNQRLHSCGSHEDGCPSRP